MKRNYSSQRGLRTGDLDGREAFVCEQSCVASILRYQLRCDSMHGEPFIGIRNGANDSTARANNVPDFSDGVLVNRAWHESVYVTQAQIGIHIVNWSRCRKNQLCRSSRCTTSVSNPSAMAS